MAEIKYHQFYEPSPLLQPRGGQEAIDRANETSSRRRMAEKLLEGSSGPRRIGHWTQGLAQLAESGIGAYLQNQADEEHAARQDKYNKDYFSIMGGDAPGDRSSYLPDEAESPSWSIKDALERGLEINNPDTFRLLNDLRMSQYQSEQEALAAAAQRAQAEDDYRRKKAIDAEYKEPPVDKFGGSHIVVDPNSSTGYSRVRINQAGDIQTLGDAPAPRAGVEVYTGQHRPKPPPGFRWNEAGTEFEMIPGSPAAIQAIKDEKEAAAELEDAEQEAAEEDKRGQVAMESTAAAQFVMENALEGAFAALDDAEADWFSFGASGTLSQIPALSSSTHAGRLRSHIATLRSSIVRKGIEELRKSSASGATGFGAMNKEELKILTEMLGALDPDTADPDILRKTLEGVRTQVEIVKADVIRNVEPFRLHELGLSHWLPEVKPPTFDEILAEIARREALQEQPPQAENAFRPLGEGE